MLTVGELPDRARFVVDSQDVAELEERFDLEPDEYVSYFVDGQTIWGMCGIIPRLTTQVWRIYNAE